MTERETVALLAGLVTAREPFVHVRFGDGDVFFATGTGPRLTADGEEWTFDLGVRLRSAWHTLASHPGRLLVGDVETYIASDGCENEWLDLVQEAEDLRGGGLEFVHIEALRASVGAARPFYAAVRADPRRKVFVGPERLHGAATMLDAVHVHVPLHVAHEHAERVANEVAYADGDVVLFSAGRGGKLMQAILAVEAPDVTQVDVGSGLDVLFTDLRRGTDGRVDAGALRAEYRAAGLNA